MDQSTKRIGDYEVLATLGSGGMGRVYKVRNVISDRVEAMKVLLPDLVEQKDLAERFLREIKVLATLNHPNIAALRTALTFENQLLMIMEYVEGNTLAALIEKGPIPASDAVNYLGQALDALAYAHGENVIHRDIKPANMMLTPLGVVKLMDFGIARAGNDRRLTLTGTTLGSLYYMSPEQVKGAPIDARSDLYSAGVSLYEMVTGKRPFQADSDFALLAAHLEQSPTPPSELRSDLPQALNEIILMAMAKDPAQRFQSATAFRSALRGVEFSGAGHVSASETGTQTQIMPFANTVLEHPVSAEISSPIGLSTGHPTDPITPPQTQPTPGVLEMSARSSGSRGLYMSLGALLVLAVLVIAGIYVPKKLSTNAHTKTETTSAPQQAPNITPSGTSNLGDSNSGSVHTGSSDIGTSSDSTQPSSKGSDSASAHPPDNPAGSVGKSTLSAGSLNSAANDRHIRDRDSSHDSATRSGEAAQRLHTPVHAANRQQVTGSDSSRLEPRSSGDATPTGVPSGVESQTSSPHGAEAEQLQELDQELVRLAGRAGALSDTLDHLRQQQAAQGLGLRSDVSASQQRMAMYMAKAQTALQNQDGKSVRKYLDLAEPEVENLEKFLGH